MPNMNCRAWLAALLPIASAFAQSPSQPTFEVASFKLTPAGAPPGAVKSDPERWSCTGCSLTALLTHAYAVFAYQVDAPEWANTTRFDVVAKLPAGIKREEFRPMLQHLLEERLNMKAHRESRETAVYELVIAKGGPKLREVTQPDPPPPPGPAVDRDGYPNVPGGTGMQFFNGRGRIQFRGQTMKNVAHYISAQVDRPVLDATGLTGTYALTLSFRALPRNANGISAADTSQSELGPTIYEALESQLGLKLRPAKRPVEMIVVDHVEKTPIEN
jgi:uncharacterized protein (TIGR03435 family)